MPTLLQPSFWLSFDPVSMTEGFGRIVLCVFVAMVLFGIVARVRAKKITDRFEKSIWRRSSRLLVWMGFLGLLLGFFGYERVRFLGARFWYVVWVIGTAFWAWFLVRFARGQVPKARAMYREKQMREKYLPEADQRR